MTNRITDDVFQIAQIGLDAEAFAPAIEETRDVSRAPARQVYGEHLGNYVDRFTDGMRTQMGTTLPKSALFMDSMVGDRGEAVGDIVIFLEGKGITPTLYFRPHYDPSGQFSPASIGDYASTAKQRLRRLLMNPSIMRIYQQGKLWIKLFNETNIGTEGVPQGREGFATAESAWNNCFDAIKPEFPLLKFLSICPTMGNGDGYFYGDALNAAYWFHGQEAADEAVLRDLLISKNPADWTARTRQRVATARDTCPMRRMLNKCDGIGMHIYGNTIATTSGNLQTWLSRRHEQWIPFLPDGKPIIISEWDFCHDETPQIRGEQVVWWLTNVVAPNLRIVDNNIWWDATNGEADDTWAKNYTRTSGGVLLPVAVAVGAWRNGDTPDVPDNPDPTPTDREEINILPYVTITDADVPDGSEYWHLYKIERTLNEAGGLHHVFFDEPHTAAAVGKVKWGDREDQTATIALNQKPSNEPAGNIPMFSGNHYSAWMHGGGALGSDMVLGMRLGGEFEREHDSYHLWWELKRKESTMTLEKALIEKGDAAQILQFNPRAALQDAIERAKDSRGNDLVPNSPEFALRHDNKDYLGQRAESYLSRAQAESGVIPEVYVFYCLTTNFSQVWSVQKK